MKVSIGKYPDRLISRVYSDYMTRKYGYHNWGENTRFESFLEKIEDTLQWIYNHTLNIPFLDERKQKVKVRIDPHDTWSMDHTLAHIVVPMLKQLKETKHGAPFVDMEDRPEHLRCEIVKYETDEHHFEAWDWVMDEMIWAFEQKLTDWEEQYYGDYIKDETKVLGGYFVNSDDEGRKAHQERMSRGFALFGKYYEGLWD